MRIYMQSKESYRIEQTANKRHRRCKRFIPALHTACARLRHVRDSDYKRLRNAPDSSVRGRFANEATNGKVCSRLFSSENQIAFILPREKSPDMWQRVPAVMASTDVCLEYEEASR